MTGAPDRDKSSSSAPRLTTLQSLIWPEPGLCTERDLYLRLDGAVGYSDRDRELQFAPGGLARFDTYFNAFNIGKWARHCALTDIRLALRGSGRFELVVLLALPERSWERLSTDIVTLRPDEPLVVDLSGFARYGDAGVLFFELRALGAGTLVSADWETAQSPRRIPELAIAVTTFRREAAVRESVRRFQAFMERSAIARHLHMIVVDNGQSAGLIGGPHVTPILNENLGGSGGFARGLIEADRRGASHCLFMDDDASIHMGSIERTWSFLAFAENQATAVAGAMTIAAHKWALWENGALFDSACRPKFLGTDLRDFGQVAQMELTSTAPAEPNMYGGWWFFAFPIAHARHRPFPFFVRGDDVSFGLANRFNTVTLPGVVCFQDADFSQKESLQTLYLDLRSHMVHHLALPQMDIGRRRTWRIAAWFLARSMVQMHYESMAALNLAFEDVIAGPRFFAENADMSARRTLIGALRRTEAWSPLNGAPPRERRWLNPQRGWVRALMRFTLNGHLLPFFGYWGNRLTLSAGDRGNLALVWGAAAITYVDARAGQSFTVRHSKVAAFRQCIRHLRDSIRFWWHYDAIKSGWREGYERMATDAFWIGRLNLGSEQHRATA